MGQMKFNPQTGELQNTQYCIECGTELLQNAKFCYLCGAKQQGGFIPKAGNDFTKNTIEYLYNTVIKGDTFSALKIIDAFVFAEKDLDLPVLVEDYTSTLIDVCMREGEIKVLKKLVDAGTKVTPDLIMFFVRKEDVDYVKFLITKITHFSDTDSHGNSLLDKSISINNIEIVKELIKAGVDVNQEVGLHSFPPLFSAVSLGSIEIVKELIKAGAKVNQRTRFDESPLTRAISTGNIEIIKELIRAGADANEHNSPLMCALQSQNLQVMKELINVGADVNYEDKSVDLTPLIYAIEYSNLEIVKELIKSGANVNYIGKHNWLGYSILDRFRNKKEVADILIKAGAISFKDL